MKILQVGLGGYGNTLLQYFIKFPNFEDAQLCGVVDPYAKLAPGYDWVVENNIPIYDTIADFFAEQTCDFAIVATPPFLHKSQCIELIGHGVNVLCEKPIAPTLADLAELDKLQEESGKTIAVGFQWSYASAFLKLKEDMMNKRFGKTLSMKVIVPWKRAAEYYDTSSWKGRIHAKSGDLVKDCIATNATAHYIQNPLFLQGDTMSSVAPLVDYKAELYRCKPIETYDTALIKGTFADGATFLYLASHSVPLEKAPSLCYEFEKATVNFDNEVLEAKLNTGEIITYGKPNDKTPTELYAKIVAMQRFVKDGTPLSCDTKTVCEHLKLCEELFENTKIYEVPEKYRKTEGSLTYVPNLYEAMLKSYEENSLPEFYKSLQ